MMVGDGAPVCLFSVSGGAAALDTGMEKATILKYQNEQGGSEFELHTSCSQPLWMPYGLVLEDDELVDLDETTPSTPYLKFVDGLSPSASSFPWSTFTGPGKNRIILLLKLVYNL